MKQLLILALLFASLAASAQHKRFSGHTITLDSVSHIANYAGDKTNVIMIRDTTADYWAYAYVASGTVDGNYIVLDAFGRRWQSMSRLGGGAGGGGGTELDGSGFVFMTGTTPSYIAGTGTGNVARETSTTLVTPTINTRANFNFFDGEINDNSGEGLRIYSSGKNMLQSNYTGSGFQNTIGMANGSTTASVLLVDATSSLTTSQWLQLWHTSDGYHMGILGDGKVGIGAIPPTALLHVNGTVRLQGLASANDTTTYKPVGIDANGNLRSMIGWPGGGGGSDGNGIYDGSGSLSGNTTVTLGSNNITFNQNSSGRFKVHGLEEGIEGDRLVVRGAADSNFRTVAAAIERKVDFSTSNNTPLEIYTYETTSGVREVFTMEVIINAMNTDGDEMFESRKSITMVYDGGSAISLFTVRTIYADAMTAGLSSLTLTLDNFGMDGRVRFTGDATEPLVGTATIIITSRKYFP
jgi:hypothetical protein